MSKYKITEIEHPKYPWLHRIQAVSDVNEKVPKGTLGGFIENENNLSQEGTCWIYDDAICCENGEVKEEAGIAHVRPVSENIFSLESLTVDGHVKKGKYISSHLHLNITYLLETDSEEDVRIKADENSGVAWFTPEEALQKSTEPWFVERVYGKLIEKVKRI